MREIGGYFELELKKNVSFLHSEGVCLNSGRHALEFILRNIGKINHLWIPYFTCEVVLEPIKRLKIPYNFYHINSNLELKESIILGDNDYILVTNYFGIKDKYIIELSQIYEDHLIVDNAQAFFSKPIENINTIYSPRKFVGIPDGGIAFIDENISSDGIEQDYSYDRCSHLLKRLELEASYAYSDFRDNSRKLSELPILKMSLLTRNLLSNIDFEYVRKRRLENFKYLHSNLCDKNSFNIPSTIDFSCPMVYPFYSEDKELRMRLINNKVYVAKYWPNVQQWCDESTVEYNMVDRIIPIPIDQRNDTDDMNRILEIIK